MFRDSEESYSMSEIHLLYSVPFRIGNSGSSNPMTAWHQVSGLVSQGVRVHLYAGGCEREIQGLSALKETMVLWGLKFPPMRFLGPDRSAVRHDRIVARALRRLGNKIDIVHCWPSGSLETLKTARELGVKTFLERPSSHTRFVYDAVNNECEKLGMEIDKSHYTALNERRLAREENEFELADKLLCPSEWVVKTFLYQGTSRNKIARHQDGFDGSRFSLPAVDNRHKDETFKMIFVGSGEPRKGLHYALDAWLTSEASKKGIFYICGSWIPAYREVLADKLNHLSIRELGFQADINSLLQECHALVLPSISEGSAIATYEARACGCVPLVSESAGAICQHMQEGLVHKVGDVQSLCEHIDLLASDRQFFQKLQEQSIACLSLADLTWEKAAKTLVAAYHECLNID